MFAYAALSGPGSGGQSSAVKSQSIGMERVKLVLTFSEDGVIRVGSRVRIAYEGEDEDEFVLAGAEELDTGAFRLSTESPLGRALLGRHVGERVRFRAPGGIMGVTVRAVR
jgi:transcription elongation GreA/GreB family factor